MSGFSRFASSRRPATLLSFQQFKDRGSTEPVRYDPAAEKFPEHAWYAINQDTITAGIQKSCSSLLGVTQYRTKGDTEIFNLHTALEDAKTVSYGKSLCIALLGEQGTGKSSILCSLLGRYLVNISSSSTACTAFPTIITYKKGASDDTGESDVFIDYLSKDEIRECVEEQARRYRFGFPRKRRSVNAPTVIDVYNEYYDEDEEEQEEESESEREQIMNNAATAKDFFSIIFDAYQDPERALLLQDALSFDDIEKDDSFLNSSVSFASERLTEIGAQNGFTQHEAVLDEDLADVREGAELLWPLVKSIRLATGHRMLRNNLSFIDLPGYGDDNQIRTAVVEKFREMADFEIVITPTERVSTSVTHSTYLKRSVRRLGARKTLLVANKSDSILADVIPKGVNRIREPPFPEAKKLLKETEQLLRERSEPRHLVMGWRAEFLKTPASQYFKLEEANIKGKLREKGICVDVHLVSARQYSFCLDVYGDEAARITAEATGIPRLRQYLLKLPAQENYNTLQFHVHETLQDILENTERILTKFDESAVYAMMRNAMKEELPKLRQSLKSTAERLCLETAHKPWGSDKNEQAILAAVDKLVNSFIHPTPYWATFLKLIKEKGIPVNGVAKGRNLNQEIMKIMEPSIQGWYKYMTEHVPRVEADLDAQVQPLLRKLWGHIEKLTGHPVLKERASSALSTRARRIGMAQAKLRNDLETSLRATYAAYTNETHVHCPFALAMRPIYDSVLDVIGGPGAYRRHRNHLHKCLCNVSMLGPNFAKVMASRILATHVQAWGLCCNEYVSEVMAQLMDFSQIADELLDSGGYVKAEHREIRDKLQASLPAFKASLSEVQSACPYLETTEGESVAAEFLESEDYDNRRPAKQRRLMI